ncbi:cyclin-A2-like [Symsagittifera roscoffensis]|uniref:cyclin-A2-like n=1 Tax=Symsagittifera roscoffensis TaxID=84072 RepID=UPI00307C37B9
MDVENANPVTSRNAGGKNNGKTTTNRGPRTAFGNITNATVAAQSLNVSKAEKVGDVAKFSHFAKESNPQRSPERSDESMEIDSIGDSEIIFTLSLIEIAFREPEYCSDALTYWREAERLFLPSPRYLRRQREIDNDMRSTLVDWLVEVGEEFKLCNETLYLSVAYVDRFLSVMSCTRDKLQLAGVAAMFIASKYEEIYPPTAVEFVNLTDNTYNARQLLRLEKSMLKALKFELSQPSSNAFLNHFLKEYDDLICETDPESLLELENLSKYICELTLLQGETFLCFLPSQKAAASLYVAAAALNMDKWMESVPKKCGFSLRELESCIRYTHKYYSLAPKLTWTAIQDKYKDERFGEVAERVCPKNIPLPLGI